MEFENCKFRAFKVGNLYRIISKKDFKDIKTGDLGGFIQNESNLEVFDDSWIYNEAKVYENAKVYGNSTIKDRAQVYGNAQIQSSVVCANAQVYGNAKLINSLASNETQVFDNALLNQAEIFNEAKIYGDAQILSYSIIGDKVEVFGSVIIDNSKKRYGNQKIGLQKDVKISIKKRRKLSEKS